MKTWMLVLLGGVVVAIIAVGISRVALAQEAPLGAESYEMLPGEDHEDTEVDPKTDDFEDAGAHDGCDCGRHGACMAPKPLHLVLLPQHVLRGTCRVAARQQGVRTMGPVR